MSAPPAPGGEPPGAGSPPDELVDAMRRVLASSSADRYAETPTALRSRLAAEVGDRHELRGQIHRLVMAADEQVPQTLSAAAPVDDAEIDRLARGLAATRGWSAEAARETVEQWATALGVRSTAASAGPAGVEVPRIPAGVATAESTALPASGAISVADNRMPSVTSGPERPSPAVAAALVPGAPTLEPWPRSSAARLRKATTREQGPVGGVYRAFHPRSPVLLAALMGSVLLLMLVLLVAVKVLVGFVPLLLVLVIGRLAVPEGHLVVDDEGGRFYRSLAAGAVPQVQFDWAEVQIIAGRAPRIDTPQGPLWLWFGESKVAAAARSRAGRSAP